jgi:hypothetical protein
MPTLRLPAGFGVILIGVGLVTAFVLGDFIPGMVFIGWIITFTGVVALARGDSDPTEHDSQA